MTKAIFSKPEDLQTMCDLYFADCTANETPLSMVGLALGVGFNSRRSLYDYLEKEQYAPIIKKAMGTVERWTVQRALKSNGAGAIFLLKNMGYTDRQVVEIEPVKLVITGKDADL